MPFNTHILKKISLPLSLIFLFAIMLLFPAPVLRGASGGLLLWFNTVLPTLFPFILICNLMISTKAVDLLLYATRPLFCRFFGVSPYGSFAVLSGFLCGYPMGAKVTADLYRQGNITKEEASYLLSFCNNTSPMFIISYILLQNLKIPALTLPLLSILTAAPVLLSFLFRRLYHIPEPGHSFGFSRETDSVSLDDCIMNGFETITRIGGYIILFSILISFAGLLPVRSAAVTTLLLPSLEITTGITMICSSGTSLNGQIMKALALTSFGGWCAAAQTRAMIQGTSLPFLPYIAEKLITALATSLLVWIFLLFC